MGLLMVTIKCVCICHVIINIPIFSYLSQHSITRYKCYSTQYNKILQCLEHVLMNIIKCLIIYILFIIKYVFGEQILKVGTCLA